MAKVKRSVLGCIAEMVLFVKASPKGFEIFGLDKLGRKVVFSRRTELDKCVADAADTAQQLANFRKKVVRLEVESEEPRDFLPENE